PASILRNLSCLTPNVLGKSFPAPRRVPERAGLRSEDPALRRSPIVGLWTGSTGARPIEAVEPCDPIFLLRCAWARFDAASGRAGHAWFRCWELGRRAAGTSENLHIEPTCGLMLQILSRGCGVVLAATVARYRYYQMR